MDLIENALRLRDVMVTSLNAKLLAASQGSSCLMPSSSTNGHGVCSPFDKLLQQQQQKLLQTPVLSKAPIEPDLVPSAGARMPTASPLMSTASPLMPTASPLMPTAGPMMHTASPLMPTASALMPAVSALMPTASSLMPTVGTMMPTVAGGLMPTAGTLMHTASPIMMSVKEEVPNPTPVSSHMPLPDVTRPPPALHCPPQMNG